MVLDYLQIDIMQAVSDLKSEQRTFQLQDIKYVGQSLLRGLNTLYEHKLVHRGTSRTYALSPAIHQSLLKLSSRSQT